VRSRGRDGEKVTDIDTEMSGVSLGWADVCGQGNGRGTLCLLNVATFHSTDRQTKRKTQRQTDTKTDRHIDRQTQRQT